MGRAGRIVALPNIKFDIGIEWAMGMEQPGSLKPSHLILIVDSPRQWTSQDRG
jgi:hypothetical protein